MYINIYCSCKNVRIHTNTYIHTYINIYMCWLRTQVRQYTQTHTCMCLIAYCSFSNRSERNSKELIMHFNTYKIALQGLIYY
jgi:hypothetical protein